jgi:excinuclease UvrABC helicase subunit UvrB
MAVRFECPIYTYDFILEAAGVVLEDQEEGSGAQGIQNIAAGGTGAEINMETLERYTVDDLQTKLSEVLDAEDYETAARIRDEIRRREQKS